MPQGEGTPFVIDYKQRKAFNYGAANAVLASSASLPTSSNGTNSNNTERLQKPHSVYCLHGHSNIEVRDHCHTQRSEGVDVRARRKLIIASVLCLFFMVCEIVGGTLSKSLAVATDAAHLLTDFASFMISLFAIWIAGRPSTQRMSFGWYRAEVIGALASVLMIWCITAILVWMAVQRIITGDFEIDSKMMLITSGLAIIVNIIMGVQLQHGHSHGGGTGHSHGGAKGHSHGGDVKKPKKSKKANKKADCKIPCPTPPVGRLEEGLSVDAELPAAGLRTFSYQNSLSLSDVNAEASAVMAETAASGHHHGGAAKKEAENLNVRAAFIHVLGDMVQSIGVFVAALIIYFKPEWSIADPITTFIFSVIVLFTTFSIMKDALLVLMEGTPSYMHYAEVLNTFQQIEGVKRVHNLRIWALSINKIALSVHLAIVEGGDPKKILQEATTAVHMRYNFFETTIQIEDFTPQMESCIQCTVPDT